MRGKDFVVKTEDLNRRKIGKRVYLNDIQTKDLMNKLNEFFESEVNIPRIRVGKKQTIETLINEEALQLAKFIIDERHTWTIRMEAKADGVQSPIFEGKLIDSWKREA